VAFTSLRTVGFRNLVDTDLELLHKNVILIGENGQGKTNFLEALYFCAYASSFRPVKDADLISNGKQACAVEGRLSNSLHESIQVILEKGRKTIEIDGKKINDRKELLQASPCIMFCYEDMNFVSGTTEDRRWFFDQCISLYDPLYLEDLRRYRHILKTRNLVFKSDEYGYTHTLNQKGEALLDTLDPQFAEYGLNIMFKRHEAAGQFSAVFTPLYEEVSGIEGISIQYAPSWKTEAPGLEQIIERLKQTRPREKAAGVSLSGPHRDRYVYGHEEGDFSAKASTGQRRLLALLLRVAQARRFTTVTRALPVLLLDDVLLELDPEKRRRFLDRLPDYDQAFYTFLPEESVIKHQKEDAGLFSVDAGLISRRPSL
jgi:DNA replication and repair protein RecF